MKWIGLTGGIATGKSAVSEILRSRGCSVIDADVVARDVVVLGRPGLDQVVARFGKEVLNSEGQLDRKKLGQKVFSNPMDLKDLELILHPLIQDEVRQKKQELSKAKVELAFYDVALLFEKKLEDQFDGTLLVWCEPDQQLERLMKREQISKSEALLRVQSQIPILEKRKLATWSIDNSKDKAELPGKVDLFLDELKKFFK